MRHANHNRKFGRDKNQRVALLQSLASSLIIRGRIRTTDAKARELRPHMEKMVTLAKRGTPASVRLLEARLRNRKPEAKSLVKIAKDFTGRAGGYTRIMKLPPRKSDGAKMAIIEFVS